MNTMIHRGYAARIEYSDSDDCFVGHIAGINDVVGFHGASVEDLRAAFAEAVDDYLEACENINRSPQKPYSGKIMLRISPEIHSALAIAAEVSGKSINQWTADTLADVLETNPQ
jgi:predicted HicB family RNase H-like nuclease